MLDPPASDIAGPPVLAQEQTIELGELLRACRVRRGMTQRQLADLSTVSIRAIRDIESGKASQPRAGTLQLIADGLGLTGRGRASFEAAAGRTTTGELRNLIGGADLPSPPAPLDSLVGREAEVASLHSLLATAGQRLVTITGLAAVGKTRVALEVASIMHSSGNLPVLWASSDWSIVSGQSAQLDPRSRIVQVGLAELFAASDNVVFDLGTSIGKRPALLVLDGYHPAHVRVERVVPLLQECPELRVLITSRVPYGIRGERRFVLTPLPVPEEREEYDLASLAVAPSVQLLLRFVRQVQPAFELTATNSAAVAAVCRSLDGLPTALEAAALWFPVHEPNALADYVRADPLGLVEQASDVDGSADIQGALRCAVESLDHDERHLLDALAGLDVSWSTNDVVKLTGQPLATCVELVRRLLMRGLVRPADESRRTQFVVLELLRHVYLRGNAPHTSVRRLTSAGDHRDSRPRAHAEVGRRPSPVPIHSDGIELDVARYTRELPKSPPHTRRLAPDGGRTAALSGAQRSHPRTGDSFEAQMTRSIGSRE